MIIKENKRMEENGKEWKRMEENGRECGQLSQCPIQNSSPRPPVSTFQSYIERSEGGGHIDYRPVNTDN